MAEGLSRLIKLLQTFDKLGYATDPYLGNLTVSPKYLGTSISIEATLLFDTEQNLTEGDNKDLLDELLYEKFIEVDNKMSEGKYVVLRTSQTLGPLYNEVVQITDFFDSLKRLSERDKSAITPI